MEYTSTRNSACRVSAAKAILTGLSVDGGLFVPTEFPKLNLKNLQNKSYTEIAEVVLQGFLPDYSESFLKRAIEESYGERFSHKAGELYKLNDQLFSLELWHGPTAAFKDYALQLMPKLLFEARNILGEKETTLILVATSGDTGKAALEGFKNQEGTAIAVFYPNEGVSDIQRLQMVTQEGENVAVFALDGNFDDAQREVKNAFGNKELAEKLLTRGVKFSSANSINWGRLLPQIVYYVTSYLKVCENGSLKLGDLLDFCVPTGNFGDIMAGWYAKQMGVPIGRLICASNENKVLADFLENGEYNANRPFYKTSSPSMDILVSSNLERLLYHVSQNDETVTAWMHALAKDGGYTVDENTFNSIAESFVAGFANEEEVGAEIKCIYEQFHYLCDPHTAVAFCVANKLKQNDNRPVVVLSTASPYKFCEKVLISLGHEAPKQAAEAIELLQKVSGSKAPASLVGLDIKPQRFHKTLQPNEVFDATLNLFSE